MLRLRHRFRNDINRQKIPIVETLGVAVDVRTRNINRWRVRPREAIKKKKNKNIFVLKNEQPLIKIILYYYFFFTMHCTCPKRTINGALIAFLFQFILDGYIVLTKCNVSAYSCSSPFRLFPGKFKSPH